MEAETPQTTLLRAARSFYRQALDAPTEGEAFELYLAADEITNALDHFYTARELARFSRQHERRPATWAHSIGGELGRAVFRPQDAFRQTA